MLSLLTWHSKDSFNVTSITYHTRFISQVALFQYLFVSSIWKHIFPATLCQYHLQAASLQLLFCYHNLVSILFFFCQYFQHFDSILQALSVSFGYHFDNSMLKASYYQLILQTTCCQQYFISITLQTQICQEHL